jgi:TetR/AcrR family transcriptional regulator, cholesterol catabolism regulator
MVQLRDTLREERVSEKKREILEAASRVFRRKGLHAAGMRDIAAELEMAVGNLYYYFRDKEDLLAFIQQTTLTGLQSLAARVEALELRADEKLWLLVAGHIHLLNEVIPGSLAHLEVEALGEERRRPIQEGRDDYERNFRRLIHEGMSTGIFRPSDPKVAELAILGAANWSVKWFRPDGGKTAREIGRDMADLLVRGLLAPGAAERFTAPCLELLTPLTESRPA